MIGIRVRASMARRCSLATLLLFTLSASLASAQQKRPLEITDIDRWNLISSSTLSDNGKWLAWAAGPDGKDQRITVQSLKGERTWIVDRASSPRFSPNSEFLVFVKSAATDSVRAMKLRGISGKDLPSDSIGVVRLATGAVQMLAKGGSYKMPKEGDAWISFLETVQVEADDETDEKSEEKEEINDLVLLNLSTDSEHRVNDVREYAVSKTGNLVAYVRRNAADSTSVIAAVKPGYDDEVLFMSSEGDYPQFSISNKGDHVSFLHREDAGREDGYADAAYSVSIKTNEPKIIATSDDAFLTEGWHISSYRSISYSESGERIFFGVAPPPLPAVNDSTLLPEEQLNLDLWAWTDDRLQPQQLLQAKSDRERTYLAAYDVNTEKPVQLGSPWIPSVSISEEGDGSFVLGTSNLPYRMESSWDSPGYIDAYSIDIRSGKGTQLLEKIQNSVQVSPSGKYLYWWDRDELVWWTKSTEKGQEANVTGAVPTRLDNELHDWPYKPNSYGAAGWTEDDQFFLVYDKYDIWAVDPRGEKAPWAITDGAGRRDGIRYRIVRTDTESPTIPHEDDLLLSTFDFATKEGGFAQDRIKSDEEPRPFFSTEHRYGGVRKAKNADVLVYTRESFVDFPDLWVANTDFEGPRKISSVNPQQDQFSWGTAELVNWTSVDGDNLEGLLFKPDDFDASKKYPMVVNFYEKNSESLFSHRRPYFHRSTLNYSYYVSQGYVVFVPDIPYKIGYPGESAMNAVMPGIGSLIDKGFVDRDRIGAMGHSWGGYQIAYMVTQTNLFAAAVAGAPVSNMTSAYGGIRWGSGVSRMFQYERTQSRIGGSLWETPLRYQQNSPIFMADKIETPLMYQHNDHDGAVPWYQGIELFVAMRRLGKPAWMLNYNDALHWVQTLPRRRDFNIRMEQFFDHYLMDAPAPEWMVSGIPGVMKNRTNGLELSDQ